MHLRNACKERSIWAVALMHDTLGRQHAAHTFILVSQKQ